MPPIVIFLGLAGLIAWAVSSSGKPPQPKTEKPRLPPLPRESLPKPVKKPITELPKKPEAPKVVENKPSTPIVVEKPIGDVIRKTSEVAQDTITKVIKAAKDIQATASARIGLARTIALPYLINAINKKSVPKYIFVALNKKSNIGNAASYEEPSSLIIKKVEGKGLAVVVFQVANNKLVEPPAYFSKDIGY